MGNPHRKISRSFYPPLPSPLKGRRIVYRVLNRNVQSLVRSLSALLVLFLIAAGTGNKADADSDDLLFDYHRNLSRQQRHGGTRDRGACSRTASRHIGFRTTPGSGTETICEAARRNSFWWTRSEAHAAAHSTTKWSRKKLEKESNQHGCRSTSSGSATTVRR